VTEDRSRKRPALEIQIHPGKVRWGVQYLFLSRRHLQWLAVISVALGLFVLSGLLLLPWAIGAYSRSQEYQSLLGERTQQGERVQVMSQELEDLAASTEDLLLRMERIYLTYGMTADESIGHGGFPFRQGESFDSIYGVAVRHGRELESGVAEQLAVVETFIGEVESFEEAHRDQVLTTPSVSPLDPAEFVLTSPFGIRRSPFTNRVNLHPGLDMAAQTGTEILAPAAGVVVFSGRYPIRQSVSWWRYGNLVAIRHGERFITLFGHCDEILVNNGQQVEQQDVIATVGNTGWSTSPHLHYEVRRKDEEDRFVPVDPRVYILDHRWRNEERLLIRARRAPDLSAYEPLPRLIGR